MAKRYIWPQCTHAGCGCGRTWENERQAQEAVARHLGNWVQARGIAICACHGVIATFPCDKSTERTASA